MTVALHSSPADQILALQGPEGISDYISERTKRRQLSSIIRRLNADAKSDQTDVRRKAIQALGRLGFVND
ncbi:hypothetical protein [Chachezhania sediminis]|uniref:hypothetical protein n=1 Tax=Chachezhania sediminis TaxID=2599291 RepID=UPI00131A7F05|nr:hypothetical protein [Chachezhania sediminis]